MDEHDKKLKIEALNTLGISIDILNELRNSEIHALWSILNKFLTDIKISNDYSII